ncbi:MAG TPA: serine/threonine-protein kinase, partial [Polyangiaceae bacterium]|nr:serine/threonine-protein kinase [Polyangiaceae bacterium]
LLGEGGMGAVFSAEGTNGQERRAIKILHPEFVNEPQILRRFFAEAYAAQQLQHPNVAKVFEHAQAEDGSPYLVMELLEGIALSEYVQPGKPIPIAQAAPIVYGVLQALMAAHARNIIHRDLKPDNIFLVPDQHGRYSVKVLDFGIAKVMDAAGGMATKTRTGMMLGTPGYMSPEQIRDAKSVDHRADLWAVGVMFYEMVTGQEAFDAPTDFAKLTAVLTQDPRPISQVAPHLVGWDDFFRRAVARDVAARFSSADDMARVLLATARALAGAAPLPTAEFRSIDVEKEKVSSNPPVGREGTHVSAQLPSGPQSPSIAPSVQVIESGHHPPVQPRTGVKPVAVVLIGLLCLMMGFAAGAATMWAALRL